MPLTPIKVAIAEPSSIVRLGIEAQVKKLARYKVQVIYLSDDPNYDWDEYASLPSSVNLFILNPLVCGLKPRKRFPNLAPNSKFIAISYGSVNNNLLLSGYDGIIDICHSVEQIAFHFDHFVEDQERLKNLSESPTLTNREKEVLVCVVKGMINKDIADKLCLSTHTVSTHRRNLTKKLQIHSTSGLTIYAIMHKLIELEDLGTAKNKNK